MGEAKRRGTFEQRRAAAIKRNGEKQQELTAMDAGSSLPRSIALARNLRSVSKNTSRGF